MQAPDVFLCLQPRQFSAGMYWDTEREAQGAHAASRE